MFNSILEKMDLFLTEAKIPLKPELIRLKTVPTLDSIWRWSDEFSDDVNNRAKAASLKQIADIEKENEKIKKENEKIKKQRAEWDKKYKLQAMSLEDYLEENDKSLGDLDFLAFSMEEFFARKAEEEVKHYQDKSYKDTPTFPMINALPAKEYKLAMKEFVDIYTKNPGMKGIKITAELLKLMKKYSKNWAKERTNVMYYTFLRPALFNSRAASFAKLVYLWVNDNNASKNINLTPANAPRVIEVFDEIFKKRYSI